MATYQSFWTHGTALQVESPENLNGVGYYGWGADMDIRVNHASWFHLPLSSPQIQDGLSVRLLKTYLFFYTFNCLITNVHIYDGSVKVQEFNDILPVGEHRQTKEAVNTFTLSKEHTVLTGIGISFNCSALPGTEGLLPQPRLIIGSAGADYISGFEFSGEVVKNARSDIGIIKP